MPFLLYSTSGLPDGSKEYRQVGTISLAGINRGLIYRACQQGLSGRDTGWALSAADLLSVGGYDPASHSLITDVSPAREGEINLFEIRAVAGYSYREWTPIMLDLEQLFDGEVERGSEVERKLCFVDIEAPRHPVRTSLYLRGGHGGGTWNFGHVGRVNGPLLWEDAMEFFISQVHRIDRQARVHLAQV